jgi:hypothetical protein
MFLVVAKASPKLQCMSSFLAELSLLSQKFEPYLPSRVAASAVFLARWTLDPSQNPWDQSLEEFTTYKAHDLRSVVFDLQALQRRQTEYNLWTRIYNKYSQTKVWKKDFLFIFFWVIFMKFIICFFVCFSSKMLLHYIQMTWLIQCSDKECNDGSLIWYIDVYSFGYRFWMWLNRSHKIELGIILFWVKWFWMYWVDIIKLIWV